jgi:endonuclease-3
MPRLPRGARVRATLTVERLREAYPDAITELAHVDPFQLLVAVILSAQTTDKLVNLITPELFRRYPTAADLAAADPAAVEALIKPTGYFRAKTRSIIAASQKLVGLFGGVVPNNLEDLVTLPGIGRKTANVILGVGFALPGFAVDTRRAPDQPNQADELVGPGEDRAPGLLDRAEGRSDGPVARLILHGRGSASPAGPDAGMRPERLLPIVSTAPGAGKPPRANSPGRGPPSQSAPPPAGTPQSVNQSIRHGNPSLLRHEHLFYHGRMEASGLADRRRVPRGQSKSALNRVRACSSSGHQPVHRLRARCAFCYIRAELRADRPSDDRYGGRFASRSTRRRSAQRALRGPGAGRRW